MTLNNNENSGVYVETVYEFKVPFYDLDPIGVMWHGNYVKHMEDARMHLLATIGYNYDKHEESGYIWPVVTMNIKYKRPLTLGLRVKVVTDLVEFDNCLRINYKMVDASSGQVLTLAQTTQLPVDLKTKRPLFSTPEIFVSLVKDYIQKNNS